MVVPRQLVSSYEGSRTKVRWGVEMQNAYPLKQHTTVWSERPLHFYLVILAGLILCLGQAGKVG